MNTRQGLVLLALVPFALAAGCVIGSSSSTEVQGTYVGAATIEQIEPGKSQAFVLALLGEPTTKADIGDGHSIWKWRYVERRSSSGSLLLVFSSSSKHELSSTAYVEFDGERVCKAWRD